MYKLKIKLKRLGKKKIHTIDYEINAVVNSLRNLISEIVRAEVQVFNDKVDNPTIISFLSPDEIDKEAQTGKVAFGERYANDKAIESEAIENALVSFSDGMFAVFINDEEVVELDQKIALSYESEIVFLRMTFLTGR